MLGNWSVLRVQLPRYGMSAGVGGGWAATAGSRNARGIREEYQDGISDIDQAIRLKRGGVYAIGRREGMARSGRAGYYRRHSTFLLRSSEGASTLYASSCRVRFR